MRSPDGEVVPDLAEKLPGRGAWLLARRDCVEAAAAKGLFAKAFRASIAAPGQDQAARFGAAVGEAIRARALEALGLARRAGAAAAGYEKAREALGAGRAAVLITALDAAEGGTEKLVRAAGGAALVRAFTVGEQSAALGLANGVHVALEKGPHAVRFLREWERLAGFLAAPRVTDGRALLE